MADRGYEMRHARGAAQKQKMQQLIEREICAFCEEHFEEYHDNPIEFQTDHWIVSKNDYPYKRTSLHLLVVSKKHAMTFGEMSAEARADFMEAVAEIEARWKLPSYAIGIRVGDPARNGGTVEHIHAHVVVGSTDDPEHEPVRFKMSSRRVG
jgi:diadenosine tetraphosphate (Ap4A) HIT family hydrolase